MKLGALEVRCRRVDVEVERNVALEARCGCVDVDVERGMELWVRGASVETWRCRDVWSSEGMLRA